MLSQGRMACCRQRAIRRLGIDAPVVEKPGVVGPVQEVLSLRRQPGPSFGVRYSGEKGLVKASFRIVAIPDRLAHAARDTAALAVRTKKQIVDLGSGKLIYPGVHPRFRHLGGWMPAKKMRIVVIKRYSMAFPAAAPDFRRGNRHGGWPPSRWTRERRENDDGSSYSLGNLPDHTLRFGGVGGLAAVVDLIVDRKNPPIRKLDRIRVAAVPIGGIPSQL